MTSDPHPQPTGARKIGVMIATPLRYFPKDPAEQTKFLQEQMPQLGRALRELASRPDAAGYAFEFAAAVGGLCRARNTLVHEFLATDLIWLLWLDSDLDITADMILRLLAMRHPLIGGMYCKRSKRPKWVCSFMPAAEIQPRADGVLQVAELGAGAKLHHRKVFTELARLFPKLEYRERETGAKIMGFYQNLVLDGDLLSEDYYLDYLCRCAGIPILADTKIQIRHREPGPGGQDVFYPEGDFPPIPCEIAADEPAEPAAEAPAAP